MADLDDLQLNYNSGPSMPEPNRQRLKVVVIGVLVLVFAISGYLAWRARVQPAPIAAVQQQPPPRAAASPTGIQREPGDNIPLPPIDETDPLVRELVAKLSSHPKIAAWLTTDKLIRNFAVVVVNIGDGQTPTTHLRAIPLSAPFAASADSGSGVITSASYRRYDAYADAIAALDARGSAHLYATLKPRIQDAYRDLGYPQGDFDEAVKRAFSELLQVPVVEGPVAVRRTAVTYIYEDPRLETLSAAQKHLLRMGPRNIRLVQAKLREIAPYLGIATESLPKPSETPRPPAP